MILRLSRQGVSISEVILLMIFLAIACGSSIFFFFISSRDSQAARDQFEWAREIEEKMDLIGRELSTAAFVERPFHGVSTECYFRRSTFSELLAASINIQGFIISDGNLVHVTRTDTQTPSQTTFQTLKNPIISGIKDGGFERLEPSLLRLHLMVALPDNSNETRRFERLIHLRNQ